LSTKEENQFEQTAEKWVSPLKGGGRKPRPVEGQPTKKEGLKRRSSRQQRENVQGNKKK